MTKEQLVKLIFLAQRYESLEQKMPIAVSINNVRHVKQMKEEITPLLDLVTKEDEKLILDFFYCHDNDYSKWLNQLNVRIEKVAF